MVESKTAVPILEPPLRKGKFLLMGARREGGQLGFVTVEETPELADAAAGALVRTGWACVEVYTRMSEHRRQ